MSIRLPNTTVQDTPSGRATWSRAVVDSLRQLNANVEAVSGGGVSDGDKGDIVVSGTGTVWSFDTGVVTAFAKTFLDDANAAAVRTTIGAAATSHTHTQPDLTGLTTADSPQFTALNIGHASDTTISRVSAGVIAVEGVTLLTTATGQPLDATLTSLAAYNTNGIVCQTAADTFAGRTLTAPASGITVSNGNGVSGNPTLALANDLSALEGLGSTGLAARTAADTWAQRTITAGSGIAVTNGDGVSGNPTITASPSALYEDQKAANTAGGTSTSGSWLARTLNTEVYDDIGLTLSSNQISLAAGTYEVAAWSVIYRGAASRLRLRDVTNSVTLVLSMNLFTSNNTSDGDMALPMHGRFTLAGTATVQLEYRVANGIANGLGNLSNFAELEIYSRLKLTKLS